MIPRHVAFNGAVSFLDSKRLSLILKLNHNRIRTNNILNIFSKHTIMILASLGKHPLIEPRVINNPMPPVFHLVSGENHLSMRRNADLFF